MKSYLVYLNVGQLAVDNGATNAIEKMYDFAKAVDSYVNSGEHWGTDQVEVLESVLVPAIEILIDEKIPYRIHLHPEGSKWKGLLTQAAKDLCKVGENYNPKYNQLQFN